MNGFIAQAYKGYTDWWRYLLGFFFIFFVWQLFSVIQGIFVFLKLSKDGLSTEEIMVKLGDFDVLMGTLESNLNFFLLLLGFAGGFAAIILVVKLFHSLKLKHLITSRPSVDWKRIGLSFGFVALLVSISTIASFMLSPEDYELNFQPQKFLILALIGIAMVPIQTTFEELLFRGYLLQGLGTIFKSRAVPFIITSVLFGLVHIANPEVGKIGYQALVVYIGTGFLLGIMTLMDEGLELAIGFHAANNLMTALLVTADWTAFKTYSIFKYTGEPSVISDIYIPVFLIYPIILLIFAKIYKWNNWKNRLFGKVIKPSQIQS
jgi:membrane protease YdiL (CAAX protease family)